MQQATAIKVKSCKEMGGATSVMPVISQWADTVDWTVRCDWLRVASVVTCSLQVVSLNFYRSCDRGLIHIMSVLSNVVISRIR